MANTDWIRGVIRTTAAGAESVTGELLASGVIDSEIIDPTEFAQFNVTRMPESGEDDIFVVFYVPADGAGRLQIKRIGDRLDYLSRLETDGPADMFAMTCAAVGDDVWEREWGGYFGTLRVGRIIIVPKREKYDAAPGEVVFFLEPGDVFGTGRHQSTYSSIEALQYFLLPEYTVLDIGCGSGILSVIGLLLGADKAFACDIDDAAIEAAINNAAANHIGADRLTTRVGDPVRDAGLRGEIERSPFDIVVSNIYADVLIELAPYVRKFVKPGGVWISSGIAAESADSVRAAYTRNGFNVVREIIRGGWVTYTATP